MEDELSFLIEVLNKNNNNAVNLNDSKRKSNSNLDIKLKPNKLPEKNEKIIDFLYDMPKLDKYPDKENKKENRKEYSTGKIIDLNKKNSKYNNILLPIIKHQSTIDIEKYSAKGSEEEEKSYKYSNNYSNIHEKIL